MKRGCLVVVLVLLALVGVALLLWREDVVKIELRHFPGRASWQLPERVVESLELEAGARVADLGTGDGYFVPFLSETVGSGGTVYAVDVDAEALDRLRETIAERGLENVEVIHAREDDPLLPDGEIDLVFLCNVYHHLANRIEYFERLRGDLAAGARVAIVEPRAEGFARLVNPPGHATPPARMIEELTAAGYRHSERHDFLPVQSLEIFTVVP